MFRYIQEILCGRRSITNRMRYEIARAGVGLIHVVLLICFFCIGCTPLAVFNCFSVFFYAVIAELFILREKYITIFAIAYLEIIVHSLFACIIMGWGYAFALYNIGLIYVAYYFTYISPMIRKKIIIPSILGLINIILTLGMRMFSYIYMPVFKEDVGDFKIYISCMNIIVSALMIMFFAALHSTEIRKKEYELRKINAELDKIAHYDALTKLRNRHSMEQELHARLDKTKDEYCFIMGDIDDFKQFNDTYGHACGDYVLQSVAEIITKNMADSHIACRWGGEEILILTKGSLEYSCIIAEKIRYEIEHMNSIYQDKPIHVTMTLGVAPYDMKKSFEKGISAADIRLYKGKQAGKNCVISK